MIERCLNHRIKVIAILSYAFLWVLVKQPTLDLISSINSESRLWKSSVDLATLIGPIAIIVTLIHYWHQKKDEKKQTLILLQEYCLTLLNWVGGPKGDLNGWTSDDCKLPESLFAWATPFQDVFSTEDKALSNVFVTPGIVSLPQNITKQLSDLNQTILNLNTYLESIRSFKYSAGAPLLLRISRYYSKAYTIGNASGILDPRKALKALHDSLSATTLVVEKEFVDKLTMMYVQLHRDAIGTMYSENALYPRLLSTLKAVDTELLRLGYVNDHNSLVKLRQRWS